MDRGNRILTPVSFPGEEELFSLLLTEMRKLVCTILRSLVEIFDSRKKSGYDENSLQIKVSFLELYNEEIFDLLSKGMDLDRKQ